MKKHLALLLALVTTINIYAKREVFARSFMYTKPAYYDVVMEQALWHDIEFNKKGSLGSGAQVIPFYQDSMSLKKNARYFLINGKTELLVAGDETPERETRDIRAEWVNLPSDFKGILSVNPRQKQGGVLLEYNQDLKNWFDVPFLREMYILILMPICVVKNNINLTQTNSRNENETFPKNILDAFNQPSWNFSRIDNHQKKKVGVAELRLEFGTCYESHEFLQLNYYTVLAIPTGNKQNARTMFQPVNGNNHHLGIGGGVNLQVPFNKDTSCFTWCGFLDLESVILIRNKQLRTYDLYDKPWSRFLMMNVMGSDPYDTNINDNFVNQPGVNYMTQKITSKPFNVVDFAAGWRCHTSRMEAEIGYGIWGHASERTNLDEPFTQVFCNGETDPEHSQQPLIFGIAGSAPGKTASKSTIAYKAPDDLDFVPIAKSDFDPQSGESYGGFVQRAFGSIGWIAKGKKADCVAGGGWSVDVPFHNSFLQLWKVWLKLSATF